MKKFKVINLQNLLKNRKMKKFKVGQIFGKRAESKISDRDFIKIYTVYKIDIEKNIIYLAYFFLGQEIENISCIKRGDLATYDINMAENIFFNMEYYTHLTAEL